MNESKPHSNDLFDTVRAKLGLIAGMDGLIAKQKFEELVEQYEGMAQAYREQRGMREAAEMRLAESVEQFEASRDGLKRIVEMHQYRDPDELPTLAFRMKEVALEALDSNPASEPKENCSAR